MSGSGARRMSAATDAAVALSAEAQAVLKRWQPAGLDSEDMAVWAVAAPTVRGWVAAAATRLQAPAPDGAT